MIRLKAFLAQNGITQASMARHLCMSKAAVNNIMQGQWPVKRDPITIKEGIKAWLAATLETTDSINDELFTPEVAPGTLQRTGGGSNAINTNAEALENAMLLKKQTLTQAARQRFGLFQDPFSEDIMRSSDDVFATPDSRYVREALWSCARLGGFMAVVSESGGGKSTLRRDLLDRIAREKESVIVIEPYVLGMEDNDRKGKTLKAASIAEAIISTTAPLERPRLSPEARYAQLHRILRESSRAGNRHLLVIEEAHSLPVPTLKHLKRFRELEDGFKKLLGIVLIGQTELRMKLSETNPEVREVTQRVEVVELQPLDTELEGYLKFKLSRAGADANTVFSADAYDAMRSRMIVNAGKRGKISLLYPLAVNNFVTAAMNLATDLGAPIVDANIIKEV